MKGIICHRVLRWVEMFVRLRLAPGKFKPTQHLQEFEKSCPLPPRTRTLVILTLPADHPNPRPPRTFSVSNSHLSANYKKTITRTSFCCNKIVRSMHLFLTKVTAKVVFMHKHF